MNQQERHEATDELDLLLDALITLANRTSAPACPQWALDEAYALASAAIERATGRKATRENRFGLVDGEQTLPGGGPGYGI